MGLDMYLTAKNSFYFPQWDKDKEMTEEMEKNQKLRELFPEMFESGNLNYITIEFEVGYWRKSNHIHAWFVDNVQDGVDECQNSYVSRDELRKLLDVCKDVLKNKTDAENILPTRSGFFFGGTDYDEWYFKDLKHTIEIIEKCLTLPKGWTFYYHSSW